MFALESMLLEESNLFRRERRSSLVLRSSTALGYVVFGSSLNFCDFRYQPNDNYSQRTRLTVPYFARWPNFYAYRVDHFSKGSSTRPSCQYDVRSPHAGSSLNRLDGHRREAQGYLTFYLSKRCRNILVDMNRYESRSIRVASARRKGALTHNCSTKPDRSCYTPSLGSLRTSRVRAYRSCLTNGTRSMSSRTLLHQR